MDIGNSVGNQHVQNVNDYI